MYDTYCYMTVSFNVSYWNNEEQVVKWCGKLTESLLLFLLGLAKLSEQNYTQ